MWHGFASLSGMAASSPARGGGLGIVLNHPVDHDAAAVFRHVCWMALKASYRRD
jgi:hypothetical protein